VPRFGCLLQRVAIRSSGGWTVTYLDQASGSQETLTIEYVVISTGLYCSPNIPDYKVRGQLAGWEPHYSWAVCSGCTS
jgi:cation diffusion facilitator CzcD-associated flavoprotein CzcO